MSRRSDGYAVCVGGEEVNHFDTDGSTADPAGEAAESVLEQPFGGSVELWEDGERVATWTREEISRDADGQARLDPR